MRPIGHTTKFKLSKDHSFHTIGSRFAREREIVLTALGVSLAAADAVSPWAWFDPRTKYLPTNVAGTDVAQTWQRSSLNGYSAHSMLYDIKRVLERSHSLEQTAILIVGECEV